MGLRNPTPWGPSGGSLWTIPRAQHAASLALGSGSLRLSYFTAPRSGAFTTIRMRTGGTAAAATPTLVRMGVYSVADNGDIALIGSHANDTALFATINTAYAKTLTTPVSLAQGARYACAVIIVTGAATPTVNGVTYIDATTAGLDPREAGSVASQTDLPASVVAASIADTSLNIAFGLIP